jgi:dihydrodipicolinate synthase/N-acetylneuraminate lyase
MPLAASDVDRFWEDLARAVPEARWIHYAHPRCGPPLTGADYARLAQRFPEQFVGSKLSDRDIIRLTEILMCSADLAHFITDPIMAPGMMMGARGSYSYWVNTLPRWHRQYMNACLEGNWAEADACHKKLTEWQLTHLQPILALGYNHGIVGKTLGALTGFLEDTGITKAPYAPVPLELQRQLKTAFDQYWAPEIAAEGFLQRS